MGAPQYEQAGADVAGSGTPNTIPRWTGASTLGDSVLVQIGAGIGLGTSTLYTGTKLQVSGSGGVAAITSEDTNAGGNFLRWLADTTNQPLINWTTGSALRFATSTSAFGTFAERARIDSSGNLSIGYTGGSWSSTYTGMFLNRGLSFMARDGGDTYISANAIYDSSNAWKYVASGSTASTQMSFQGGATVFSRAVAGTAGSALTWLESARIDSAGRLLVGVSGVPVSSEIKAAIGGAGNGGQEWIHATGGGIACVPINGGGGYYYTFTGLIGAESYTASFKAISTGIDVSFAGYGLKLPATPGNTDPNTLDAYVDGGTAAAGGASFTATLKGSTTDPTTPVTTTGKYVLVGKVLTMSIYFDNVNTTGASGDVIIETNLAAALRPQMRSVGQVGIYNFNAVGLGTFADARTDGKIYIMCNQNNNVWTAATHSAGAGRYLLVTVTFIIG